MKETIVLVVSSIGLIVLGYGIRLLHEEVKEWGKTLGVSSHDVYIDWSKVPKDYNYVGVNVYNNCYMAKTKLNHRADGFLEPKDESLANVPPNAIIGPLPSWCESLRKRPGRVKK